MNLETLLKAARQREASDVHLVVGLPPAFRIGGEIIFSSSEPLKKEDTNAFAEAVMNARQKAQFHDRLELCFSTISGDEGRIRVSVYLHAGNPELAIRMCNLKVKSIGELRLPKLVDELAMKPDGLVLVTGPAGVGKTTTLNYMIDHISSERRCKIITIEDPVEFAHSKKKAIIVQQELYTDFLSFPRALVHALRQDPDVIVVGEMRELETISIALTAAETGHLVMATLHTPSATQSIERIIGAFPLGQQSQALWQLSSLLQGIVAQKLLPRSDKKGLVLAYETMVATLAVRNMIREGAFPQLLTAIETGSKYGMKTMTASLVELYQQGLIGYDTAVCNASNIEEFNKRIGLSSE